MDPLLVRGLTVGQARQAIYDLYVRKELIRADNNRILVSLLQPRQVQVLVFRQEAQIFQITADGPEPVSKRNTGRTVDLPAYENDVLHALVRSGGLPELDAYNEIVVYRDGCRNVRGRPEFLGQLENARPGCDARQLGWTNDVVRIPLRLPCGDRCPSAQRMSRYTPATSFSWKRQTSRFTLPPDCSRRASTSCRAIRTSTSSKPWPRRTARCTTARSAAATFRAR